MEIVCYLAGIVLIYVITETGFYFWYVFKKKNIEEILDDLLSPPYSWVPQKHQTYYLPINSSYKLDENFIKRYERVLDTESILKNKKLKLSDEYRKTLEWKILMENLKNGG